MNCCPNISSLPYARDVYVDFCHFVQVKLSQADVFQDFFEAVFNYFPITFKPPPDDPYGITAQDLKDRLRNCISATGFFAPYAFPALLDKLDSTSPNTKVRRASSPRFGGRY